MTIAALLFLIGIAFGYTLAAVQSLLATDRRQR